MNGIVFNFHDVVLLFIAGECGLLAILFLACRGINPRAHTLLAMFLIFNMLVAVDTLMYWGEAFRYWVFHLSPDLFFLFGFAYFLQGPALYFYVRLMTSRNFSFRRTHILHLLPAIAAQLYLYFAYHRHPEDIQGELVLSLKIFNFTSGYHDIFLTTQKSIVVAYGIACFFTISRGCDLFKRQRSKNRGTLLVWLYLLVGGFLLVWFWGLITHIFGIYRPSGASDMMGVTGNYMTVVLTNVLVFYSLLSSGVFGGLRQYMNAAQTEDPAPVDPRLEERVCAAMESGKLFLNPRLTVEEFAGHVNLPPRQVSSAIKRRYGCNFLEYVNSYRVEEAKIGLADPANRDESVLDIASKSGFNSKATFNRFFKKFAGVTPTEYRRRCLSGLLD
ncbi:helix-turn-helix domain-containing protein [Microbulbifer celer]|uniref:Helix-turn-helix domain-containing protein n=1 Tax=Microbulbifer celer TaxID=435905 RepID=A0ABW3UCU6_9GAMM|nr:AraC family transcriptional regulator [Microbulbifer celer]UFN57515.1 AraC family transcriptional regulator [Microbulbifer celer]